MRLIAEVLHLSRLVQRAKPDVQVLSEIQVMEADQPAHAEPIGADEPAEGVHLPTLQLVGQEQE
jgi:hypothetical protein